MTIENVVLESEITEEAENRPLKSTSRQNGKKPQRKRHGARNQHRHKSFVKWLVDTFDLQPKQEGGVDLCHILDVAGGKGEVSTRLCMCHRQHVVMVDPRPANIVHCFETLVLPKIPNKWQCRLEEQRAENPSFVEETVNSRFRQLVTTFDDHSLAISEELQQAVEKATLILGLHADGATEAIVDAALQYKKPFVVVPCCVFPNLFTTRRVEEEGRMVPVRSHEQFCRYLASKDSRFKTEVLPFEGRNQAIWWDGNFQKRKRRDNNVALLAEQKNSMKNRTIRREIYVGWRRQLNRSCAPSWAPQ